MYRVQFGAEDLVVEDVRLLEPPLRAKGVAVAWASSPCTDLSLAGSRVGIGGARSSAFFGFTGVLGQLDDDMRPAAVVLENVVGLASSHGGEDLRVVIRTFNDLGYSVDLLVIDACRFLPQSRPRLFVVGARRSVRSDEMAHPLRPAWTDEFFGDSSLFTHRAPLAEPPPRSTTGLAALLTDIDDPGSRWWEGDQYDRFVELMSPAQQNWVAELVNADEITWRTGFRRTRKGIAVWELRPDDIAGCLRTAGGGSSRQAVVRMGRGELAVRWLTGREYAALMGASDYRLDGFSENQVKSAFGDAVAVPVVHWLAENYIVPLLRGDFGSAAATDSEAS